MYVCLLPLCRGDYTIFRNTIKMTITPIIHRVQHHKQLTKQHKCYKYAKWSLENEQYLLIKPKFPHMQ